jgi:AcrR family transcriptional regulator
MAYGASMATRSIPAPAAAGRVARRRAVVRQRVLEIAEDLMETRGVDAVTIDDITDAADIARRSFYHHFESKHDVLVPIARARTKGLNRRIDRLVARMDDPAEMVATGIRHALRHIAGDPLCRWFVLHSGLPHDRLADGLGESGTRDIRRGIETGRFRVTNPRVVETLLLGSMIAVLGARAEGTLRDADVDDAAEHILRLLGGPATQAHTIAHGRLRPQPPDPGPADERKDV